MYVKVPIEEYNELVRKSADPVKGLNAVLTERYIRDELNERIAKLEAWLQRLEDMDNKEAEARIDNIEYAIFCILNTLKGEGWFPMDSMKYLRNSKWWDEWIKRYPESKDW